MKSQEYFEKYFENAKSIEEIAQNGNSMFQDMLKEIDEIKKQRKVKTFDGTVGIVRELNDKWNAVAGKVERKFSEKVIKRNVVWNLLLSKVDESLYPRKPD